MTLPIRRTAIRRRCRVTLATTSPAAHVRASRVTRKVHPRRRSSQFPGYRHHRCCRCPRRVRCLGAVRGSVSRRRAGERGGVACGQYHTRAIRDEVRYGAGAASESDVVGSLVDAAGSMVRSIIGSGRTAEGHLRWMVSQNCVKRRRRHRQVLGSRRQRIRTATPRPRRSTRTPVDLGTLASRGGGMQVFIHLAILDAALPRVLGFSWIRSARSR